MMNLDPCDELLEDRDQIRDALLTAFHDVILKTTASDSDEMAARTLLDVVAYVVSFKLPTTMLVDQDEIGTFTRNETLRFEMYLREHLLRRRSESDMSRIADDEDNYDDLAITIADDIPTAVADGDDIPTQPAESIDSV